MSKVTNRSLLVCLGLAVSLGACGADSNGDNDDDERAPGRPRPPGSSVDATIDAGIEIAPAVDAGAPSSLNDASISAVVGIDIEVGQNTPQEPAKKFEFVVTRAQEVPPCTAGKDSALGVGRVIIADSDKWVEVTVGSKLMSARANGAHVHFGARGKNGPIALNFGTLPDADVFYRRFTAAEYPKTLPPNEPDFPPNFAAFVAALRAGKAYVNLHTPACASGEIRGQITQD